MKRLWFAMLVFASLGLFAVPDHVCTAQEKPPATEVDGNIDWVFDYQQGKQISQNTGKPMFVVFRCER
jgi:hypothetical protein